MTAEELCGCPACERGIHCSTAQAIAAAIRAAEDAALEHAEKAAADVERECSEQWERAGGEDGSPEHAWFQHVPADQWGRQVARYSGSGGADASGEISARIRALRSAPQTEKQLTEKEGK